MQKSGGITVEASGGNAVIASAATIATLAWAGVVSEAITSFGFSRAAGRSLWASIAYFYQFFTNQVITLLACIMTATVIKLVWSHTMLSAKVYAAIVVYATVTSATYEILLRHLWSPKGLWFARDALMHDLLPALTLAFWHFLAPKQPLDWLDPIVWLSFPALYLTVTLSVGAATGSYPYSFLDPGFDGGLGLLGRAAVLTVAFYGVGMALVGVARLVR